jgi:hypothetical protein
VKYANGKDRHLEGEEEGKNVFVNVAEREE